MRAPLRAGDAEIGQLHLALDRQQNVPGGHVAVDDVQGLARVISACMGVFEGAAELGGHVHGEGNIEAAALLAQLLEQLLERHPLDELHRDVIGGRVLAEIEDADDVLMIEEAGDVRLVDQHLDEAVVGRQLVAQHFERNWGAEAQRPGPRGEKDLAHPASRELS